SDLELLRELGLEENVARSTDRKTRFGRSVQRYCQRAEERHAVAEIRVLTRLAVRRAQPQRAYDVLLREEGLFTENPREVHRWIRHPAFVDAESRVAIGAHATGEEKPILPSQLFECVAADR